MTTTPDSSDHDDQEGGGPAEFLDEGEDDANERWVARHLTGSGRRRKTDAMLSCPACFTLLCADCQRHVEYANQYRAMFVTRHCHIRTTEVVMHEEERYHPVVCSKCDAAVGVYCIADEVYHFYNVLPSE
jgi:hypothetical protein